MGGAVPGSGADTTSATDFRGLSAGDLASAAFLLARRFNAGATLWCVSPGWPEHARHVAVEFVHPVIVGKRALPAHALTGTSPALDLRTRSRPGDVMLLVSAAAGPGEVDLLARASRWGLASILLTAHGVAPDGVHGTAADGAHGTAADGAHGTAADRVADHVLRTGEEGLYGAEGVLAYHLLWELTHVCLEHPGLLAGSSTEEDCATEVCTTCSDEGRPAEILAVSGGSAWARSASGIEEIDVSLVGPISPGDAVLVHAGVAISELEGTAGD